MKSEIEALEVFLHDQAIGTIIHLPGDRNLFSFNHDYINNLNRPTLSLSFKDELGNLVTDIKSTRTRLPSFFSNVLPEGYMREYLASHAHVHPEREFYLLAALGNDLPGAVKIGTVTLATPNGTTPFQEEHKNEEAVEGILHFSLAGVQLKFSGIWENHTR